MDEHPEQPKKKWRRKMTPRQYAFYLASKNIKYLTPIIDNRTVAREVPEVGYGIEKVRKMRTSPEFQETVEEILINEFKKKQSQVVLFWMYLKKYYEANYDSEKPDSKLLDILGFTSGEYAPRHIRSKDSDKGKDKLDPSQIARLIHEQEQIKATLEAVQSDDKKDGEDG